MPGRLRPELLRQATRAIREDRYVYAQVFRGRRGSETQVAGFHTRLAAADSATLSRDQRAVLGDTAPQAQVLYAPDHADIQKSDEVWVDGQRYRVIAVDALPGTRQVLVQSIQ